MPALTTQTAADIRKIQCTSSERTSGEAPDNFLAYELVDEVFSDQKFRGRLKISRGRTSLLQILREFSAKHPEAFQLQMNPENREIFSINGVENHPRDGTYWFVTEVDRETGKSRIISGQLDSTFPISEAQVLYRISYKVADVNF